MLAVVGVGVVACARLLRHWSPRLFVARRRLLRRVVAYVVVPLVVAGVATLGATGSASRAGWAAAGGVVAAWLVPLVANNARAGRQRLVQHREVVPSELDPPTTNRLRRTL